MAEVEEELKKVSRAARRSETEQTLVYKYGGTFRVYHHGQDPEDSRERFRVLPEGVTDQVGHAHRLWNRLVEEWYAWDATVEQIWRRNGDVASALDFEAAATVFEAEIRGRIGKQHADDRQRITRADLAAELKEARDALAVARRATKDAKKAAQGELREQFIANKAFFVKRGGSKDGTLGQYGIVRQEAVAAGLYWGTANAVLASFRTAIEKVDQDRRNAVSNPDRGWPKMRFRRWDGTGRLAAQVQRGEGAPARTPELLTTAKSPWWGVVRLPEVMAVPEADWKQLTRAEMKRVGRVTIQVRVGSTEDKKPLWAEIPIQVHRPLPACCEVKEVEVIFSRDGERLNAAVCLTIGIPRLPPSQVPGTAAVHVGWRAKPDGSIRVGYLKFENPTAPFEIPQRMKATTGVRHPRGAWLVHDTVGGGYEILVPKEWRRGVEVVKGIGFPLGGKETVTHLRSHRDTGFNKAKDLLMRFLENHPDYQDLLAIIRIDRETGQEVVRRLTPALVSNWRRPEALHVLLKRWPVPSHPTEHLLVEELKVWHRRDRHLGDFARGLDGQLLGERKDAYRVLAAALGDHVGAVIVDDIDLYRLAKKNSADRTPGESAVIEEAAGNRQAVAPYELRDSVAQAASRRSVSLRKVSAIDITTTHAICGQNNPRPPGLALPLVVTCRCGMTYDVDANAVDNLLRGGAEG